MLMKAIKGAKFLLFLAITTMMLFPSQIFAGQYANVVVVAKSGGDFDTLQGALASITDNSETKRYLIKIMPGTYTTSSSITLKPYVDIEGSGENNTILNGNNVMFGAVVFNTGPYEIRSLTIKNNFTQSTGYDWGVFFSGGATATEKLTNVTVEVTDSTSYGLSNGAGIAAWGSDSVTFQNVTVKIPNTMLNAISTYYSYGSITINNSFINGAISSPSSSTGFRIVNSMIKGGIGAEGRAKTVNCYNANYDVIANGWY